MKIVTEMVSSREPNSRFAVEPSTELLIGRKLSRKYLYRDEPIEARVAGFVDFAHPARAECGEDLVRAETRVGGKAHFVGTRRFRSTKRAMRS